MLVFTKACIPLGSWQFLLRDLVSQWQFCASGVTHLTRFSLKRASKEAFVWFPLLSGIGLLKDKLATEKANLSLKNSLSETPFDLNHYLRQFQCRGLLTWQGFAGRPSRAFLSSQRPDCTWLVGTKSLGAVCPTFLLSRNSFVFVLHELFKLTQINKTGESWRMLTKSDENHLQLTKMR